MVELIAFQGLNAVVWAFILALVAIGFSLIFSYMDVVNVAHGALYSAGAIVGWYIWTGFGGAGPAFLAALVGAAFFGVILGLISYYIAIRPIEHRPTSLSLVTTFGLLFIIQQANMLVFGGASRTFGLPVEGSVLIFSRPYPIYRLLVAAISALAIYLLWLTLYRTRLGLWVRAVQQSREVACSLGIPARGITRGIFAVGSALAAFAAVLAAPLVEVRYDMGLDIIIDVFIIVIASKAGSMGQILLVALIYKCVEGAFALVLSPLQAHVVALVVIMVWILLRSYLGGRLGRRG